MLEAFVAGLEPEVQRQFAEHGDRAALQVALSAMMGNVRDAWPMLGVDANAFVADIAARIEPDAPIVAQVEAVQAADLYLAWACGRGDASALAEFEAKFGRDIDRAVCRVGKNNYGREDLAQKVREKLFVSDGERPARITAYSGRGSLRSWVRVTGIRTVLDVVRWKDDSKRRVSVEAGMLEAMPNAEPDPELDYLRQVHGDRLPQAMRLAFESLTSRQRNLLRHKFLHGLSTERIAKIYGVHRATAFRWLEAARTQLFERTRDAIKRDLKISGRELESLIAALRSRIDVSMGQLLSSDLEDE
jgi:RNA polymerase sigma-70 factor (ECF subfamily)